MRLEDMRIYQIAVKLRKKVHEEVRKIPKYWSIKDAKQILGSSSSVPSNIAEGFGRRFYPKDFIHFLNISAGSSDETKNHAQALADDGYFSQEIADHFKKSYKDLAIRINNLIVYINKKHNLITNR